MPVALLDVMVKDCTLWRALWLTTTLAVTVAYVSPTVQPPGQYHADKLMHLAAFGAIAFPACFAAKCLSGHLMLTTFNLLLGIGLEVCQIDIPGRNFSVFDIGANGLGVLSGLALGFGVAALIRGNQNYRRAQRSVAVFTLSGRTSPMSTRTLLDCDENIAPVARRVRIRPAERF